MTEQNFYKEFFSKIRADELVVGQTFVNVLEQKVTIRKIILVSDQVILKTTTGNHNTMSIYNCDKTINTVLSTEDINLELTVV